MILAVELRYGGIGVGLVVPEFFFSSALAVPSGDKIVPIVELLKWPVIGYAVHGISPNYERLPGSLQWIFLHCLYELPFFRHRSGIAGKLSVRGVRKRENSGIVLCFISAFARVAEWQTLRT